MTTERPSAATIVSAKATGRPGNTTGRDVISSWSLAKVTMEPAKDTEPTRIVNAVAASVKAGVDEPTFASSSSATSAAAPPPTPLNSATSCGIWVICTRRAPTSPTAVPTAMATRIATTWSRWA